MRFDQINVQKPNLSSTDDEDNFMKGDNLLNKLMNSESNRKNRTKEISNCNNVTTKESLNSANREKTKRCSEGNVENCTSIKRPSATSICNRSGKKTNTKQLDRKERNKIRTETGKVTSLKSEKLAQEELLKNLHEERIKNIEAKARSNENYLAILNERMKNKTKIAEGMKKQNDTIMIPNNIHTDTVQSQSCEKLNKYKNRELAEYQLKQHTARSLASREQKDKRIDFERNLLNQLKEEDEILQRKLLQKKLNQKKFLAEEINKWSTMTETERRKNEIPSAYPMTFPLQKMANRCRLCKKNGLRFPMEKITKLPC